MRHGSTRSTGHDDAKRLCIGAGGKHEAFQLERHLDLGRARPQKIEDVLEGAIGDLGCLTQELDLSAALDQSIRLEQLIGGDR